MCHFFTLTVSLRKILISFTCSLYETVLSFMIIVFCFTYIKNLRLSIIIFPFKESFYILKSSSLCNVIPYVVFIFLRSKPQSLLDPNLGPRRWMDTLLVMNQRKDILLLLMDGVSRLHIQFTLFYTVYHTRVIYHRRRRLLD